MLFDKKEVCDLFQIDLDQLLIQLKESRDLYKCIASLVYKISVNEVTKTQRNEIKLKTFQMLGKI